MSKVLQTPIWKGWRLTCVTIAALILMSAVAVYTSASDVEGMRLVIRLTARTSLVLFLSIFIASSLAKLMPTPFSIWLCANRRYLGVAFAGSHAIHAAALVTLAKLHPQLFSQLTSVGSYIGGGIAYAFIVLMTATSFDRSREFVGSIMWRAIHTGGIWFIWISFVLNFGKRIPKSEYYMIPVALLFLALALHLIGFISKRDIRTA